MGTERRQLRNLALRRHGRQRDGVCTGWPDAFVLPLGRWDDRPTAAADDGLHAPKHDRPSIRWDGLRHPRADRAVRVPDVQRDVDLTLDTAHAEHRHSCDLGDALDLERRRWRRSYPDGAAERRLALTS